MEYVLMVHFHDQVAEIINPGIQREQKCCVLMAEWENTITRRKQTPKNPKGEDYLMKVEIF